MIFTDKAAENIVWIINLMMKWSYCDLENAILWRNELQSNFVLANLLIPVFFRSSLRKCINIDLNSVKIASLIQVRSGFISNETDIDFMAI